MSLVATLADPVTRYSADGILNLVNVKSQETATTIKSAAVVFALIAILYHWWSKGRTLASALTGIIMGAIILYGVFNVVSVKDRVQQEVDNSPNNTSVSAPAFPSVNPGHPPLTIAGLPEI